MIYVFIENEKNLKQTVKVNSKIKRSTERQSFTSGYSVSILFFFFLLTANDNAGGEAVERLRNITKMFGSKKNEDDDQQLQRVEKVAPSDKIRNTFQK